MVCANHPQIIDALKNNMKTEIRRIPQEIVDRVITSSQSNLAAKSLDRAHYKLLSYTRKMVAYEEQLTLHKTSRSDRPM